MEEFSDQTTEDSESSEVETIVPFPPKYPRFLAAMAFSIAMLALSSFLHIGSSADTAATLYILATLPVAAIGFLFFEKRGHTGISAHRIGWIFIGLSVIAALLSVINGGNPLWFSLGIAFGSIAACSFFYGPAAHARGALFLAIAGMLLLVRTSAWQGWMEWVHANVARFTCAILDGTGVPNHRSSNAIQMLGEKIDVAFFTNGWSSLEVLLFYGLLYCLLRRTSLLVGVLTPLSIMVVWMSMRSIYWSMLGHSLEFHSFSAGWLEAAFGVGVVCSYLSIPIFELFLSNLLSPISEEAVATEFALFLDLYNYWTKYPKAGFVPMQSHSIHSVGELGVGT